MEKLNEHVYLVLQVIFVIKKKRVFLLQLIYAEMVIIVQKELLKKYPVLQVLIEMLILAQDLVKLLMTVLFVRLLITVQEWKIQ
jgi:hypothetical protein